MSGRSKNRGAQRRQAKPADAAPKPDDKVQDPVPDQAPAVEAQAEPASKVDEADVPAAGQAPGDSKPDGEIEPVDAGPAAEAEDSGPPAEPAEPDQVGPLREPPSRLVDGAGAGALGGPPPPKPAARPCHPYEVAPGRSLVTARGHRDAGAEITVKDLATSDNPEALEVAEEQLEHLVQRGYILKA